MFVTRIRALAWGALSSCALTTRHIIAGIGFGWAITAVQSFSAATVAAATELRPAGRLTVAPGDTTVVGNLAVDISMNSFENQRPDLCAESCFVPTYSHTTPAYYSLDQPRNVTLMYDFRQGPQRPFVYADAWFLNGAQENTTGLSFEVKVKWAADYVSVPFTNGDTRIRFDRDEYPARVGGQLNAGHRAIGVYPMRIIVTAHYYGAPDDVVEVNTNLVLITTFSIASMYKWSIAGVQQLIFPQTGGILALDGYGGGAYFKSCGVDCYQAPEGEYSRIAKTDNGATYTRTYPDRQTVKFSAIGYMLSYSDRFGNTTKYNWNLQFSQLTSIEDPFRLDQTTVDPYDPDSYVTGRKATIDLVWGPLGLQEIREPGPDGSPNGGRVTRFEYDPDEEWLTKIIDPDAGETRFTYNYVAPPNADWELATITDRRGGVTKYFYHPVFRTLDSIHLPAVKLDAGNGTETGLVAPRIKYIPWQIAGIPSWPTDEYNPYASGIPALHKAYVWNPDGRVTTFTVNRWGQPHKITDPLGRVTTLVYDRMHVSELHHPNGTVDTAEYDWTAGSLTYLRRAGQPRIFWNYGGTHHQLQSFFSDGRPHVSYGLGPNGRVDWIKINQADSLKTSFLYNARGQVTHVIDHAGHTSMHYEYDDWGTAGRWVGTGNMKRAGPYGRAATTKVFDGQGRDSVIQTEGQTARFLTYDAMNRLREAGLVGGQPTRYDYDGFQVRQLTDPLGQIFHWEYNALGWLTREIHPDPSLAAITYRYSASGLPTSMTNRRGQRVDQRFDALRRLLAVRENGLPVDSFWYDPTNRMAVAISLRANVRDSVFIATTGWVDSVASRVKGKRLYRYRQPNAAGQLERLRFATSGGFNLPSLTFYWGAQSGQVDSLRVNNEAPHRFTRTRDEPTAALTYSDGLAQSFTTQWHNTVQIAYSTPQVSDQLRRSYAFDTLGRAIREGRPTHYEAFTWMHENTEWKYSPRGWLTDQKVSENHYHSGVFFVDTLEKRYFRYDSAGNLKKDSLASGVQETSDYSPGNRLTRVGSLTIEMDHDGNISRRYGGGTDVRYFWSARNQLDSVVSGNRVMHYRYNALGHLVSREVRVASVVNVAAGRNYLWENGQLIAELNHDITGRITEYVYRPGVDRPIEVRTGSGLGAPKNIIQDLRGNVIGLARNTTVYAHLGYTAHGAQITRLNNFGDSLRLRWKAMLWEADSTQLYYARNRWYSPALHRFMSEDPAGAETNQYLFASNDPINLSDPTGLEPRCAWYTEKIPWHSTGGGVDPDDWKDIVVWRCEIESRADALGILSATIHFLPDPASFESQRDYGSGNGGVGGFIKRQIQRRLPKPSHRCNTHDVLNAAIMTGVHGMGKGAIGGAITGYVGGIVVGGILGVSTANPWVTYLFVEVSGPMAAFVGANIGATTGLMLGTGLGLAREGLACLVYP